MSLADTAAKMVEPKKAVVIPATAAVPSAATVAERNS